MAHAAELSTFCGHQPGVQAVDGGGPAGEPRHWHALHLFQLANM